jgi:hypothetical protein
VKQPACRRSWQVEAARDGRLFGLELRSFEIHAEQCKTCARERRELDRLANALQPSSPPADEIALRRERERVLEAAHRKYHSPPRRVHRLAFLVAALVGALLCAAALLNRQRSEREQLVDVVASPGARWERRASSDGAEEIRLTDGVFSLAVHRKPGDPRVLFVVPDGSIDDVGTEFQVTVADGHTRGLVVRAGAVMLKLSGQEPVLLRTPSSWTPPPGEPSIASTASTPEPAPTPPHAESAPVRRVAAKKRASTIRDATPTRTTALSSEDLAYLRIVALRREGRSDEARVAAAEYLHSFPDGFRHTDVLSFVRAGQ